MMQKDYSHTIFGMVLKFLWGRVAIQDLNMTYQVRFLRKPL